MVQIPLPPQKQYAYTLFGGAYDGSMFVCGPGAPHYPPARIELIENRENDLTRQSDMVMHRYEFDLNIGEHGGYTEAKE